MNYKHLLLALCSTAAMYGNNQLVTTTVSVNPTPDLFLIDGIKSIIYTPEGTEIITQSDLERPGFDGQVRSLDQLKFEGLAYLNAIKFDMLPNEQAVEESRARIEKDNNLSRVQFDQMFEDIGYTPKEGMQELKRMQAISTIVDFKVRSNLVVPRTAIVAYYNENPVTQEASYQLEQAFIPFSSKKSKKEQRAMINDFVKMGKRAKAVEWSEPFWVMHGDIAEDKHFIYDMHPGEIKVVEEKNGFLLIRLKDKKDSQLIPLEERYQEIAEILRKPRFEELMDAYKKELFESASIVDL